jgi:predicted RNase H-like nuclease (RuvC/YqgF family)
LDKPQYALRPLQKEQEVTEKNQALAAKEQEVIRQENVIVGLQQTNYNLNEELTTRQASLSHLEQENKALSLKIRETER